MKISMKEKTVIFNLTEQCAKNCPVGAISFDDPTCTDKSKCITYMRCIAECPKKAKCLPSVLVSVVSTVAKSQNENRFKKNTKHWRKKQIIFTKYRH